MKFKLGDRVAVYGNGGKHYSAHIDQLYLHGDKAEVTAISGEDEIEVTFHQLGIFRTVHPKQCRKLRKVTKSPRRKLYAVVPDYGVSGVTAFFDKGSADRYNATIHKSACDITEFVEVRRKK